MRLLLVSRTAGWAILTPVSSPCRRALAGGWYVKAALFNRDLPFMSANRCVASEEMKEEEEEMEEKMDVVEAEEDDDDEIVPRMLPC
jgi:hypothetical protein